MMVAFYCGIYLIRLKGEDRYRNNQFSDPVIDASHFLRLCQYPPVHEIAALCYLDRRDDPHGTLVLHDGAQRHGC